MKNRKKIKIWRYILLGILILLLYKFLFGSNFDYDKTITIKEWDTLQTLISDLSWKNKIQVKLFVKRNKINLNTIQVWSYIFSGNYKAKTFVDTIMEWPKVSYHTIRILEWWSIYDIDHSLTSKWLAEKWEYISFAENQNIISKYQNRYEFLPKQLKSLEWFLYPDTYKVDIEKNIIDQLVYLQLDNFAKKVWKQANELATPKWFSRYDSIIMASIVEKEEKNEKNRPIVAGILIKRQQIWMLIWADISLCYFFKIPYSDCNPNFIAKNVADKNNPYNTRTIAGLPPTPVGNPSINSIMATLKATQTDYLYYLHDSKWQIWYGKTLEEHNANKKKHL